MYSYRLMSLLGLVIFLLVTFVLTLYSVTGLTISSFDEMGTFFYYERLMSIFASFDMAALPFLLIFSATLLVSNTILLARNGKSIVNVVGILTGFFLIGLTFLGMNFYNILDSLMDIHSYFGYHFSYFLENIVHVVVVYLECMLLSSFICTVRAARHVPKPDADYIIILGCYAGNGDELPSILKARVDRAYEYATDEQKLHQKSPIFIPSGGKGSDEKLSEAATIAKYLRHQGVTKSQILIEDRAISTYENFKFSKKLIPNRTAKVVFATTGYHVFRSGVIANSVGLSAEGIGSKVKWYFYLNATVREFFAELMSEKKRHIINIILLNVLSALFVATSYFADLNSA